MKDKPTIKQDRLRVQRVLDVPLREVSGICLRRRGDGRTSLIAVGDGVAKLASLQMADGVTESLHWEIAEIGKLRGSQLPERNPQIEAVSADGAGRILLLQETPPRAEFVDLDNSCVIASFELEVGGSDKVAESWSDSDGSRGEGVVLLPCGHLLVAKEKDPAALIEFGPEGEVARGFDRFGALADGAPWPVEPGEHRFIALAVWRPDKALRRVCKDFSDLEVGPDGRLYLLSDKSSAIAQLDVLQTGDDGGGTARLTASWRVDDLNAKPEGLAFDAEGCAIVALDTRKSCNNLVQLEPAIAAPSPSRDRRK